MTEAGFKPISSKLLPNEERNAELVMIASVGKVSVMVLVGVLVL